MGKIKPLLLVGSIALLLGILVIIASLFIPSELAELEKVGYKGSAALLGGSIIAAFGTLLCGLSFVKRVSAGVASVQTEASPEQDPNQSAPVVPQAVAPEQKPPEVKP